MYFALNYSPQAAELVRTGEIQIDFFKTPPWQWMVTAASQVRPVMVHFELRAGSGKIAQSNWAEIETYLANTSTRYVNLHLNAKDKDFGHNFSSLPADIRQQQVLDCLLADVSQAVQRFGAERVIVENVPYRGPDVSRKLAETALPQVISRVVEITGCGFLLDIPHARISANTLGLDPHAYIHQLPLAQLKEIHFTGLHTLEDGYLQDHLELIDSDWEWLAWASQCIHTGLWPEPFLLAFEYGGTGPFFEQHSNREYIRQQVPHMQAILENPAIFSSVV